MPVYIRVSKRKDYDGRSCPNTRLPHICVSEYVCYKACFCDCVIATISMCVKKKIVSVCE